VISLREIRRSVYNLKNSVLQIGFVGENDRTRVVFECKTVFDEYPSAVPSLAVKFGTTYPAIVSVDSSDVIWDVKSTDLTQEGEGEIQLTFSVGEVVVKSYIVKVAVKRSLMPSGERPDQIDDWITEANTILGSIPGTIDSALQEAKDSGEFDGVSPTASVTQTATGATVTITDASGTTAANLTNGQDGEPGQDGVSPTISVTDITGGHQVTITDATGSRTVDVMDGKKGDPGTPGEDGTDGISPTVSVTPITDGNQITITDKTGPHIFTVMDGKKGDKGDPGEVTQTEFDALADDVSDLNQALKDKADIIISSASGSIASFPDGAEAPVKSLTVGIEPVQDLHGYDSPWPAGGGKNIFDGEIEQGALSPSTGEKIGNTERYRSKNFIKVKPNTRYRFSVNGTATSANIYSYDENKTYLSDVDRPYANDFTTSSSTHYLLFFGTSALDSNKVQIEEGGAVTSWTPYSNICPITGWTGAKVTRTGKNLVETVAVNRTSAGITFTTNADGTVHVVGTSTGMAWWKGATTKADWRFLKAGTYILTGGKSSTKMLYIIGQMVDGTKISNTTIRDVYDKGSGLTFTLPKDSWLNYQIQISSGQTVDETYYPMISLATATAYEPYQGQTYDIEFPSEAGTVYGGTLDVTTGVLTVDRAMVDMGTLTWNTAPISGANRFYSSSLIAAKYPTKVTSETPNLLCSAFKAKPINTYDQNVDGITAHPNGNIQVYADAYKSLTKSEFKTAMSGVQFVYELAAPITYQLTPQEVRTLLGQNNIWADTGDTSVIYRADTKLYIEQLTKPTEDDMTANTAITSGKFFMIGNRLFLATAAIASGAMIIPGTNCTELSLADALNNINT